MDTWLDQHPEPEAVTDVLHVHLYDVVEPVDDEVTLARIAQQIAQTWRDSLATQFARSEI